VIRAEPIFGPGHGEVGVDAPEEFAELLSLVDRVEGWTSVSYAGRRYGLSRITHTGGRSVSLYAKVLAS
jgi:hypothetical protein